MSSSTALVPIKYITERYDESGLEAIVPSKGYETISLLTKERIRFIDKKVGEAMTDYSRASSLLSAYAGYLGSQQTARIEQIYEDAFANSIILGDVSKNCYDSPGTCIANSDARLPELKTYDRDYLSLDRLTNLNRVGFGAWFFGYQLPANVFKVDQTASGFLAEDLDGFVQFSPSGEGIRVGGSFRNRPCSEVESLLNEGKKDLDIASSLAHAVLVTQTKRSGEYSLRILAAYRTAAGECASYSFHSKDSYRSEIDFSVPSSLKRSIVDTLSSVSK
jgi:hypothetical protein